MGDSYRFAVNSNVPPSASQGRQYPKARTERGLNSVPEESPTTEAPPSGYSYRVAVGSGGHTAPGKLSVPETISEDSVDCNLRDVPAGYSYRVAVGDQAQSNFRGGFRIPEAHNTEDKRNIPGYSYRVAVGEPARQPPDAAVDGLMAYDEPPAVQHADPKKFHPKKKALAVSFNPTGDSNINPAFSETGSRTVSNTSLNSVSSKGDPVYHVTPDGRVLKKVIMIRPDGSRVIVTDADRRCHKPLKEKHVKRLWVLSIVAIVLFFPTGIPAFLYARRTKMKYYVSLEPSTLYRTNTYAKRTERLIIASVVLCILIIVLVAISVTMGGKESAATTSAGGRLGVVSTAP